MNVYETNTDLDSHANQCVLGSKALVVYDYDKPVIIVGYDPSRPITSALWTVSRALAYDCPETGATFILVVNQGIHNLNIDHNSLSTLQLRLNDIIVNDKPKFLTDTPTERDHAIIVTDPETNNELLIPLSIKGVSSTFPTCMLTQDEYLTCPQFTLTYDSPEYEPTNGHCEEMEWQSIKCLNRQSQTWDQIQAHHLHSVSHSLLMAQVVNDIESDHRLLEISSTLCNHTLLTEMKSVMHIASVRVTEG
jgi:hypothetical protein